MAAADKSGLSCKSIYGNKGTGVPGDSAAWYDGWSSMCKVRRHGFDPGIIVTLSAVFRQT